MNSTATSAVPVDGDRTTGPAPTGVSCCVALRVQETQDQAESDVAVVLDLPRVAIGEPQVTLRGLIAYRFRGAMREALLDAVDELGQLELHQPVQLEGLQVWSTGTALHVEALVLPITPSHRQELEELLSDGDDPQLRHELGWLYAEDLANAHAEHARLPVRFLSTSLPASPPAPSDAHDAPPLTSAPALVA